MVILLDTYTNKKHYAKHIEDWGNHWASMIKTKDGMKLKKMFIKTRFEIVEDEFDPLHQLPEIIEKEIVKVPPNKEYNSTGDSCFNLGCLKAIEIIKKGRFL